MDKAVLHDKVYASFMGGMCGSALDHLSESGSAKVDSGMRYQCLILQAWLAHGYPTDASQVAAYLLREKPDECLDFNRYLLMLCEILSFGRLFPQDKVWDAPYGWFYAATPWEVRSGGMVAAAAVCEALQSGSTLESMIQACLQACDTVGIEGGLLRERIQAVATLVENIESSQDFVRAFHERFLVTLPDSYLEVLPAALGCVMLAKGNVALALDVAIALERCTSAIAGLTGQIAGALTGSGSLPQRLLQQVIADNPELELEETAASLGAYVIERYRQVMEISGVVLELGKTDASGKPEDDLGNSRLYDKMLGTLVGGACGDALGCPVEWMHFEDIRDQWGWVDGFVDYKKQVRQPRLFYESLLWFDQQPDLQLSPDNPLGAWSDRPGTYSDDMRFRLLLCHGILEKGGAIDGSEFAELLLNYRTQSQQGLSKGLPSWPGPEAAWAEMLTSKGLLEGMWNHIQPVGACWAWDAPLGMLYPGDQQSAAQHGYLMAVCVAYAFHPDATIDSLIECALSYCWLYGQYEEQMHERILGAVELAQRSQSPYEFYRDFYDRYLVTQPSWWIYVLEQIPAALALLRFGEDDPKQAILAAVNFGRDADTIACLEGELIGTLRGASALPMEWVDKVLTVNPQPSLSEIALRFARLVSQNAYRFA